MLERIEIEKSRQKKKLKYLPAESSLLIQPAPVDSRPSSLPSSQCICPSSTWTRSMQTGLPHRHRNWFSLSHSSSPSAQSRWPSSTRANGMHRWSLLHWNSLAPQSPAINRRRRRRKRRTLVSEWGRTVIKLCHPTTISHRNLLHCWPRSSEFPATTTTGNIFHQ